MPKTNGKQDDMNQESQERSEVENDHNDKDGDERVVLRFGNAPCFFQPPPAGEMEGQPTRQALTVALLFPKPEPKPEPEPYEERYRVV